MNDDYIIYRPMYIQDAVTVTQMLMEMWRISGYEPVEEKVMQLVMNYPFAVVVENEQGIIGCLTAKVDSCAYSHQLYASVTGLYVLPKYRTIAITNTMAKWAVRWAEKSNMSSIEIALPYHMYRGGRFKAACRWLSRLGGTPGMFTYTKRF